MTGCAAHLGDVSAELGVVQKTLRERCRLVQVLRGVQQARLLVLDDVGEPACRHRHYRHPARHSLQHHEAQCLALAGHEEHVPGCVALRQLLPAPHAHEDGAGAGEVRLQLCALRAVACGPPVEIRWSGGYG
eukprot:1190193-Prorocentrum_minimum.AAC.1